MRLRSARQIGFALIAAAAWVSFSASLGDAAVWSVGVTGADAPSCGARAKPCRSLGRAIASAHAGDVIVVGPGRYGDLDGDQGFDGPGEEQSGDDTCMIVVPKPLTILASAGPAATVLDAGGAPRHAICLAADGIVLGKGKKGFTVTGAGNAFAGVFVGTSLFDATTRAVAVHGNRALGNGFGFLVAGAGAILAGNESSGARQAGFYVLAPGSVLTGNRAFANDGIGFGTSGTGIGAGGVGVIMRKNVATANADAGFRLRVGGAHLVGNVASANGTDGFDVFDGSGHELRGNAALGNRRYGIGVESFGAATVEGGTIAGNGATSTGANCGLANASPTTVTARGVYWGAASGPGDDPADAACNAGSGGVVVE